MKIDQIKFVSQCFALTLLVMVSITACSTSSSELQSRLSQQVQKNSLVHGIPAQAVLVKHNQQIIYREFTGIADFESKDLIDPNSVFPVYSISKLFANVLIIQLVEAGLIDLNEPASKYLDFLPQSWNGIKVEHYLNHMSGVPNYYKNINGKWVFPASQKEAFEQLSDEDILFPAGTRTQYTQTNYLVIKALLEEITDHPYELLVDKNIFKPIGMNNTWIGRENLPRVALVKSYLSSSGDHLIENDFYLPSYGSVHGDAYTTLDDLAAFLSYLTAGKLVSQGLLTELWKPGRYITGKPSYFASGWDYDKTGTWNEIGHDGGALVRARILFEEDLNNHYIIIYLTNGNRDGVWSRTLVDSIQYYILPDFIAKISILMKQAMANI